MKWRITVFILMAISAYTEAQHIPVIKLSRLNDFLSRNNDTTYVINFWATWCQPCVKELPVFDSLYLSFRDKKIKIILVSLDNVKELERKVIPFVHQRRIKPEVLLLDETDYNKWIDRVEPSWGGAIPATLIYNYRNRFRKFIEGETDFKELSRMVRSSSKHLSASK